MGAWVRAGVGVPEVWTRIGRGHSGRKMSVDQWSSQGVSTDTGGVTARDAMAPVLILPALIFCWGIVTVTIAALV